ncbi:MAG: divergent polysaccharide deacetylase family protein [Methylobacteriaceae bacterium]|nr:divergent polysaccharide deacetylase family protein [Methylobacteriaceae bacterium]
MTVRASDKEVESDLSWLMSRFAGYVGVVNFLGARFMSNAAALTPVMRELAQRGVAFLSTTAPHSRSLGRSAGRSARSRRAPTSSSTPTRARTRSRQRCG